MSRLGPVFHVYRTANSSNAIYTRFFNAICFIVVGKEELVDFVSGARINDTYTDEQCFRGCLFVVFFIFLKVGLLFVSNFIKVQVRGVFYHCLTNCQVISQQTVSYDVFID